MRENTPQDLEIAQDLLAEAGAAAGYWADARFEGDALVISEREPDEALDTREWWIRASDILAWLDSDGPSELVAQLGDPYQQTAVAMLKLRLWDEVDWDVETADVIIQQMILGSVTYSHS